MGVRLAEQISTTLTPGHTILMSRFLFAQVPKGLRLVSLFRMHILELFLYLRSRERMPTTRYGIPDFPSSGITNRIIGAYGV